MMGGYPTQVARDAAAGPAVAAIVVPVIHQYAANKGSTDAARFQSRIGLRANRIRIGTVEQELTGVGVQCRRLKIAVQMP
jgi:hypothetical protein